MQSAKFRQIVREEPHISCNLVPDEITLFLSNGQKWFSVSFNQSTISAIGDFIPSEASKTPYICHGKHGWSVQLTDKQGWNLQDRFEAEGGHCAFMRARGLLR